MSFLRYAWCFWTAWRDMRRTGFGWAGYAYRGVPQFTVVIAGNRESYNLTQLAIDAGYIEKAPE